MCVLKYEREEFPKGWTEISLDKISELNPKKPTNVNNHNLEVTFLPMRCVEELTGRIDLTNTRKYSEVYKNYTYFKNGDIIFAKITPCMENGKIAIVQNLRNKIGFGSTEFHVIRLNNNQFDTKFYFYYLIQDEFRNAAQIHMKGTAGQLRVPIDYMKNVLVPIPPLNEQRRIVSKIESIFAQIDACRARLMELQGKIQSGHASLESLKSSILKQAFEGKLVPPDLNDKSAETVLKKNHKNFRILFGGKNLPRGWIEVLLNEICVTKSGGTPSRKNLEYFNGNIPWIKISDLNNSVIYSCEEKITRQGLKNSNAVVYPKNTILLAMYGSIGKVSILGCDAATNQAICALLPVENVLLHTYLFWYLKSIRSHLVNIGFGGVQKNISQEKIKKILIPISPLNEQKRIVAKIESIFAKIDAQYRSLRSIIVSYFTLHQVC